jgi:hypothetical protein
LVRILPTFIGGRQAYSKKRSGRKNARTRHNQSREYKNGDDSVNKIKAVLGIGEVIASQNSQDIEV